MKKIFITAISTLLIHHYSHAQTLNWASLKKQEKHIVHISAAFDYGATFGAGYAYQLKSKLPIVLDGEYSFPAGKNLTDDFKTKIGGQARLVRSNHIMISARLQGVFRRYQNPMATLLNFGSDMGITVGYYKQSWFAGGELGFDKAIITHFSNSELAKQNFPGIKDGWYEPATGGNFYYGVQAGYSLSRCDVYIKAGKVIEQDFKTKPVLPVYAQLGLNLKL